jgi:hypothetical protein
MTVFADHVFAVVVDVDVDVDVEENLQFQQLLLQ